jgi:hypothetical protein
MTGMKNKQTDKNKNSNMKKLAIKLAVALAGTLAVPAFASSHMDAPLIILDPAANTTDVYAFVHTENGVKSLVTALGVYPFEEPGIGPNKYNFDDNVLYEIHVATGQDLAAGRATFSYQFQFKTTYKNQNTILQSFIGVINDVGDSGQNLVQTYTVTKVDHRHGNRTTLLGTGIVPPNNQGIATPFYNQDNDGNNPARDGVATADQLDKYTTESIEKLASNYIAFAGQRDDGFYADVEAIFDLLQLRSPAKDSQAGFNIHEMVLSIPVSELGGDTQSVGVYATTSRRQLQVLDNTGQGRVLFGPYVQVARQGNPLFNECLVAVVDKDLYSRTSPTQDKALFSKYASTPELCRLINSIVFNGNGPAPESNRTDIVGIFIPDVIKVDLSTADCRLAGGGTNDVANPDDAGFSSLGIFGGDVLVSRIQSGFGNGTIPGGWPNGRRFGDDVVSIALTALVSDLRVSPPIIRGPISDGVNANDVAYNKVFPYESTPHNGRNRDHF